MNCRENTIQNLDSAVPNIQARLFARLDMDGDCWEWMGAKNSAGYGQLGASNCRGRNVLAHRATFEFFNGPIGPGLCVLHRCDNPGCCNPAHLVLGTKGDNFADAVSKGRHSQPPPMCGEKHARATVTANDVRLMRQIYDTGFVSKAEIARNYKMPYSTVDCILRRKSWGHLDG